LPRLAQAHASSVLAILRNSVEVGDVASGGKCLAGAGKHYRADVEVIGELIPYAQQTGLQVSVDSVPRVGAIECNQSYRTV
jgi:hypothetical protein